MATLFPLDSCQLSALQTILISPLKTNLQIQASTLFYYQVVIADLLKHEALWIR